MAMVNPVFGFEVVKDKNYEKDCKPYKNRKKDILNTELNIVKYPERSRQYHGPIAAKSCKGWLHAAVDINLRILYQPDYEHRIVLLKRLVPHRDMERMC